MGTFHLGYLELLRAERYLYRLIEDNESVFRNLNLDTLSHPLDYFHTDKQYIQEYFCKFRDHICRSAPPTKVGQRAVCMHTDMLSSAFTKYNKQNEQKMNSSCNV